MTSARVCLGVLLSLPIAVGAQGYGSHEDSGARRAGADAAVTLPAYPIAENYLPFEVNPVTPFTFFIDAKSISVTDGVVRFTLIAKSPHGAQNVSYEGIRCADEMYRVYAYGRDDHTWLKLRDSRWRPIPVDPRNSQRNVLYDNYFCPTSSADVRNVQDAVNALKRGGNPGASTNY